MMILPLLFLMFSTGLTTLAVEEAPTHSALSEAAKKRLTQNLQTLEQNLKTATSNVEAAKKNITTLQEEIRELESLEKDYLALRKKYGDHVESVQKEIEKNNKAVEELQKFLDQNDSSKGGTGPATTATTEQQRKATLEKLERENWKAETEEKLHKVQTLLTTTNDSLKKLQARKGPILGQIESHEKKESEYRKMILEIQNKKSETQKLLSAKQ